MKNKIKHLAAMATMIGAVISASATAADPVKGVGTPAANRYTQALVTRMDVNRDGKVTQEEFMKFMEAEFNALDKDKSGMLETSEILNKGYFQRTIGD
jgi:Ca2+-binding EF-hand superfamily protein